MATYRYALGFTNLLIFINRAFLLRNYFSKSMFFNTRSLFHPVRVAGDEVFPGAGAGGGHGAGGLVEVAQGGGKGVSGVEFFQE